MFESPLEVLAPGAVAIEGLDGVFLRGLSILLEVAGIPRVLDLWNESQRQLHKRTNEKLMKSNKKHSKWYQTLQKLLKIFQTL